MSSSLSAEPNSLEEHPVRRDDLYHAEWGTDEPALSRTDPYWCTWLDAEWDGASEACLEMSVPQAWLCAPESLPVGQEEFFYFKQMGPRWEAVEPAALRRFWQAVGRGQRAEGEDGHRGSPHAGPVPGARRPGDGVPGSDRLGTEAWRCSAAGRPAGRDTRNKGK